ncbi:MAG: glycine zipper family protein [Pseudomonadota bacterium]
MDRVAGSLQAGGVWLRPHGARSWVVMAAALGTLWAGCASAPSGPGVTVLPGRGLPFEQFTRDDQQCRAWAAHSVGIPGHEAEARAVASTMAAGAAIGALAGAVVGGHHDAATGAVAGAAVGAAVAAGDRRASARDAQRRYDIAYQQCMHAKGHQVPGAGAAAPPPR